MEEERSKKDIEPFSKENVELLINSSSGMLRDYLGLAFYTGARSGEILASEINDFDFERNTISFNKQFTQRKLKKSLKTKSSNRDIPLFDAVLPYVESLIKRANSLGATYLVKWMTHLNYYQLIILEEQRSMVCGVSY